MCDEVCVGLLTERWIWGGELCGVFTRSVDGGDEVCSGNSEGNEEEAEDKGDTYGAEINEGLGVFGGRWSDGHVK